MHAFLNKDAYAIAPPPPPPPVCPATTVSRSYLDFSTKLSSPFSATLVQNNGPYFPAPKYFFNITFQVFFQNFPPRCTVTGSGTNIWWTFYNTAREKGKRCVCVSETSGNVHACVSETHVSCMFPGTKQRKQSSSECCRRSKVFTIRIHSPFPCYTDTQNAACATYIYANSI